MLVANNLMTASQINMVNAASPDNAHCIDHCLGVFGDFEHFVVYFDILFAGTQGLEVPVRQITDFLEPEIRGELCALGVSFDLSGRDVLRTFARLAFDLDLLGVALCALVFCRGITKLDD